MGATPAECESRVALRPPDVKLVCNASILPIAGLMLPISMFDATMLRVRYARLAGPLLRRSTKLDTTGGVEAEVLIGMDLVSPPVAILGAGQGRLRA